MFFIWQTDWEAQKKPFLTSRVKFQETRFRRRPAQPISRPEGAYATSKDSRLGRRTGRPIRAGVRGPNASLETLEESQEEQQGPVSHQCHTGVTCFLLGPPTAYIRVRPHALPSVPPKLLWTWEVRVECTRTTRGNPASTSARATLSTSTPASAMFVQHPQTSPLTRILVLPMRVCIRQTSHRGGSGSSQGRMERARRTRSWPSARSSLGLQVFKSTSFVCF